MEISQAIELVVGLAHAENRLAKAKALAVALGSDELMVFLHDEEADALMPAPGWRKTLPGGAAWHEFLARAKDDGFHRGEVPWAGASRQIVGCAAQGLVLVFIGGTLRDADARLVCSMAPLLKAAVSAQQALAATSGELEAARSEIRQAAALMKVLDETRTQLDRSLIELDWQARSLEQARARAERATRSKDEFMAMLGHELRNPLAPIKTALGLLRMRGIRSQELDVIQRQVDHMIRLVDDLLDVSRIAGGKLTLKRAPTEISAVIARAVETSAPLLDQRRQSLEVDVPEVGLCVTGDAARLAQVFANLLTNAAKYSDPGRRITVKARRMDDRVCVSVRDEGIGIQAGLIEKIFDLFHQEGRGLDRAQGGLGLGLAIVRNLVMMHEGTVEARSDGPGKGSTFVVELPVCASDARTLEERGTTPNVVPADLRHHILLVDDNIDARDTLATAFRALGHLVTTAADAFEALESTDASRPDVAVLDIGLPGIDGYELADRLRRRDGSELTLIAVTGYGQPEDRARATTAGFNAHFVKPVDFHQLVATIEALAARRPAV
jgi:signal transduction histidine kinase/ActR/RegA family two-component response regulator